MKEKKKCPPFRREQLPFFWERKLRNDLWFFHFSLSPDCTDELLSEPHPEYRILLSGSSRHSIASRPAEQEEGLKVFDFLHSYYYHLHTRLDRQQERHRYRAGLQKGTRWAKSVNSAREEASWKDEETIRQTTRQLYEGAISEDCESIQKVLENYGRAGRAAEEARKRGTFNVILRRRDRLKDRELGRSERHGHKLWGNTEGQ